MKAAGTRVAYDHEAVFYRDKVEIPGPTKQLLKIMVGLYFKSFYSASFKIIFLEILAYWRLSSSHELCVLADSLRRFATGKQPDW